MRARLFKLLLAPNYCIGVNQGQSEPPAADGSCEGRSLITGEALTWFCSMCLHVTLGWTKKLLDMLEIACAMIDVSILAAFGSGAQSYELSVILLELATLAPQIELLEGELATSRAVVDDCEKNRHNMRNDGDLKHIFEAYNQQEEKGTDDG